jgi:hypothetical protein
MRISEDRHMHDSTRTVLFRLTEKVDLSWLHPTFEFAQFSFPCSDKFELVLPLFINGSCISRIPKCGVDT